MKVENRRGLFFSLSFSLFTGERFKKWNDNFRSFAEMRNGKSCRRARSRHSCLPSASYSRIPFALMHRRRYHQPTACSSIRKGANRSLVRSFAHSLVRSFARSSSSFPSNSLWWRQSRCAYGPYIIGSLSSRQSTSQTIFIIMNCNAYQLEQRINAVN